MEKLKKILSEKFSATDFIEAKAPDKNPSEIHKVDDSMKIVHLCAQDFGGAGKAAYRLHQGLQQIGVGSRMLVLNKRSGDPTVTVLPSRYTGPLMQSLDIPAHESPIWQQQVGRWQSELKKYRNRPAGLEMFTDALSDIQLEQIQEIRDADIINLHWVAGILDYPTVPLALRDKKIVWTSHDMNPFTGGCHYSGDCQKYKENCGACPQLGSAVEDDLSRHNWNQKYYAFRNLNLNIITPSKWLSNCASESSLLSNFPIDVIPYGFPLDTFKPYPKTEIRGALNIPENAKVILFGADSVVNTRKGFVYLLEALKSLPSNKDSVAVILTFGSFPQGLQINTKHSIYNLGSIADENQLALAYSAADVFVIPSLEDNLPNTVVEAMACGIPVVGFEIGGIPDMIDHKKNGFLARPGDKASLLEGIEWALALPYEDVTISGLCREKAEKNFAMELQAKAYKELYHSLISKQASESEAVLSKENKRAPHSKQDVEVAEMQSENSQLQKSIADFNHKNGNLEHALEKYIKILRENPEDLEALLGLGLISIDVAKYDDCFVFCQKALEIAPKNIDVRDVFLKLGQQIELSGAINKAREIYLYYLIRNPEEDRITKSWEKLKDTEKDKQITKKVKAKQKDYTVSAIVSTYNSEEFIRECLENIESQTISKNIEIVVVDAASPQNEEKIVEEFQERYSNITYIKTRNRIGIYAAWNIAIKEASGRYCISASTNDILNQEACKILSRYLDENPECMLVYGDTYLTKTPHESFENNTHSDTYRWPPYSFQDHLNHCLVGPHPMWRKQVHSQIGFFDERYIADGDQEFWLRIGEKYNIAHISFFAGLQWVSDDAISRKGLLPHLEVMHIRSLYKRRFSVRDENKIHVYTIIIPVFNQIEYTKQCIEALYKNTPKSLFELIVVDNNSSDGTKEFLSGIKEDIKVISNTENLGFAKACNQGAKVAKSDYLVFLNNDTEVQVGWLDELVNCLKTEKGVAVVGAKLLYPNNTIQHAGVAISDTPHPIFPYHIYNGKQANFYDANFRKEYQAVTGACMLVMKDAFTKAHGFDEDYINGYEDIDFCFRVREIGFKIMYCPTSIVYHHESVSEGRFNHAEHNIKRLHKKWKGKIFPDSIYHKFGKERKLTSIIVLTYNQIEYTKKCIDSIFKHTQEPFELILVDNGSTDGTLEYLESEIAVRKEAVRVKIIKNKKNRGFAAGNNQGITAAKGDYILLMNNDVVVTPEWLERMLSCAGKRSKIGIVGPRSNNVSGPQLVEGVNYDTHTLKGLTEFSNKFADDHAGKAQQVLRVVGFCMLIKRAVIEKIGGMDDRYGLGNFEDDDFSLRAAIAGFQSWIALDCFVHHFGHRTFIGEKVDLSKSLQKNWGVFKDKWGLPADKPYGSSYGLSEMQHIRFDPSVHYYPLGDERAVMDASNNDFKTAEALYANILANLNSKPSEEVIENLQRLIESYPKFSLAYNDLGVLYYSSGNKEKALECYERAVQLDPENSNFSKNLADFYFVEMGRIEEALQIYVKILELNPQDIETLLITGHICVSLHQFENAKVFYQRVLELEPSNEAARNNMNKLDKMNSTAPELKSPEEMYQEIQPLLDNGDPHKAITLLETLLQSYPDFALAHNDLGVLYCHAGDKEKSQRHYERAVELMPDNINFQKNLADLYCIELGRIEEALQIYVSVLETDPQDVEALMATGLICKALSRFDDARDFFNQVLRIEPWNAEARRQIDEMQRQPLTANLNAESAEDAYRRLQEKMNVLTPAEAIVEIEKLVEFYPDFAVGHNDLGVLYYKTGNKEKTLHHYQQAARLQPENMTLQKNLADFLFVEEGKVGDALQIYVNILATHPDDVETLLITGHICVALKKFDDAKDFYKRVLALAPDNEDAGKNLQALNSRQIEQPSASVDSLNDVTVSSVKIESTVINSGESEIQDVDRKTTASIVINIDGIQNRVKECVKSIQAHTEDPYELLLVDRGATKGMLKWAQQLAKDNGRYRIIECDRHTGRAESLNQAIQKTGGEIIVLLHNDVVVPEDWLKAFKMCIKLEPNIGVVGPMSNRAAGIQQLGHPDDSDRVEFESAAEAFREQNRFRRVPTRKLSDFCLVFRRDLPGKIGYFDEQFASEKVIAEDFCKRADAGGYQNLIAADTYVFHYDRHKVKKNIPPENSPSGEDRKKYEEKWNGTENQDAKAFQTVLLLSKANEFSQKGQIDQAVEIMFHAIRMQSQEERLYLELSEILLAAKRYQDAKDALNEMPSANGNPELKKVLLLGYAEEGLKNYEAARAYIEQVLAVNPKHARGLNLNGILAYRNNDRNSAEKYFKRAMASDPGYGEPYTNLAMLQLEAEKSEEALAYFEKGFSLSPTDLDIATNYHAFIEGLGDFERAETVARQAADLYPDNQKIKYMLIDFLIQQGKYEMAMNEIEEAIIKFGIDDGILSAALKLREKLGPMTVKSSSKKVPVSLCMIIKDEEKHLARCLASVKPIVDEMIVVDTGSADRSKDIAITFGAQVYDYDWENDFAAARNFSISKASGQWILILDGDEVISPLDYDLFNKIVTKKPKAPLAYSIITRNYNKLANIVGWMPNDGQYPDEEAAIGWLPSEKVRLFYGRDQIRFEGAVHELIDPVLKRNGIEIKKCRIPVHHYGRLDKEKLDRKGEIYFDIGQKKLSEKGEDVNALRELAIQATILERNQEAFELWQRLLALNPTPNLAALAYVNLGTIYCRLAKFDDALDAAKRAIECDPDLKEARYNQAMAELHCGNAINTISILESLLDRFPDYPPARFILSAAYCCAGQKEKGVDGIRKLKTTPMGAYLKMPCLELARSLLEAKKMEYAILVLGAAIECDIVNKEILDLFTECVKINDKAQQLSETAPTGLTDRPPVRFEDLPQ